MSKRIKSAEFTSRFESIFKCPICGSSMKVLELTSLVCSHHHTFDFAKQGYLNLTTHPVKNKYNKELFEARRKLIAEVGFFDQLSRELAKIINKNVDLKADSLSVVDMGCGEGSHLAKISDVIESNYNHTMTGVGIDLSKEGVLVASRNYPNKIWAVADLANTPFQDQRFHVILNILSPSNYHEFNRVLNPDGVVIKVVPQSGYLKEIREAFYDDSEKITYSNVDTVEHFKDHFQDVQYSRLQYSVMLDQSSLQALVQMTPLTWATTEERIKAFTDKDSAEITVDLEILIGKKGHERS